MSSYFADKIAIAKSIAVASTTPKPAGVSRILLFIDDKCMGLIDDILMYSPAQIEIDNIVNTTYDDKTLAAVNPYVLSFTKGMFIKPTINDASVNGVDASGGVIISVGVADKPISNSTITIQYEHAYTPTYKQINGASLIYKVQDSSISSLTTKETLVVGATSITDILVGKASVYQAYLDKVSIPLPQQIGI